MAWLGTWPADMNALLECSMENRPDELKVMSILDAGETTNTAILDADTGQR